MKENNREVIKGFRLTQAEAEELSRRAAEAGMKESEYLRLCLKSRPNDFPEIRKLLRELINEVNHVGNNVNQIARKTNAGEGGPGDRARLLAYMMRLSTGMSRVVEELGDM
jgi:hypothetical protein